MVPHKPSRKERRKALKIGAAALTGFGLSGMGTVNAESQPKSSDAIHPNQPTFTSNNESGYAIGTRQNPVTNQTINQRLR